MQSGQVQQVQVRPSPVGRALCQVGLNRGHVTLLLEAVAGSDRGDVGLVESARSGLREDAQSDAAVERRSQRRPQRLRRSVLVQRRHGHDVENSVDASVPVTRDDLRNVNAVLACRRAVMNDGGLYHCIVALRTLRERHRMQVCSNGGITTSH